MSLANLGSKLHIPTNSGSHSVAYPPISVIIVTSVWSDRPAGTNLHRLSESMSQFISGTLISIRVFRCESHRFM